MSSTLTDPPALTHRPIQYGDVPAVVAIERAAHITPWSESTIRECLRVGYHCELAVQAGEAVGFSIVRRGPDDSELLNLCVHPRCQRQGIGQGLLSALLARARRDGSDRVLLDVRQSNVSAQTLYALNGFQPIGARPEYYRTADGHREAAIVMALGLAA